MIKATKVRKTWNILLRILILAATYGFIYTRVFHHKDWKQWIPVFREIFGQKELHILVFLVVVMMLVNWGIEALKWKTLIAKIEKVSLFRSFQAVLSGISVSFFTPNRVGELFARAYVLEKASHIEGILITILGSISQLLITILTGTVALVLFNPARFYDIPLFTGYLYYSLIVLIVILDLILIYLYFNASYLAVLREKLFRIRLKKFRRFFQVFARFHRKDLGVVILLSLARYIVFSTQYWLMLRIFSVPVPFSAGIVIISLVFFIQTLIPTIALTELGFRGAAAIYFFGLYFTNAGDFSDEYSAGVLAASTFLWLLNLVVPAITGTFFLYRLKFFRKNGSGN
jgi:uncharacterized membrane protein YbhN (UPF0104 family)